ncbi:SDR family NAD(P)-dependent oxidoreductase [Plantactinospora sp. GCM10030261]|uniref:type I polyketide synthase n=1 Tax=Plantactinospora sp. GCM10030261 TaxID=3273420 RepID=UPI0036210199
MTSEDLAPVEPVAVIGMAARVPGATDVEGFWRNLLDGVESVSRFDREEQLARGAASADLDDPSWVSAAPVLDKMDHFDTELFGMTEQEARLADPQHRLLLETVHAALENAGCDPARFPGPIGLFCGAGGNQYHWEYLAADEQLWAAHRNSLAVAVGNSPSYLTTLASYKLNLRGPSMAVHTACSTSLVAIHLACEALRAGECDAALAGGVSIELPHGVGYRGSDGFLSDDGHCRPFDAEASGTLWGSGVGVVMLKRLSDALADGDTIRAVVLGSAVNNDGASKVGFSAPSVAGQSEVIEQALDAAAIDPRTIGYVEAHGTGTALGDPIEVRALSRTYGADTDDRGWCGLGTVKSNIGHLSQAAGVIGFIKAALAVERGIVPPTINIEEPTPAIDFDSTPFHLVTSVAGWPAETWPRRAAVSSFGIGGTNAHAILQEPPARPARPATDRPAYLLRVSAASPTALRDTADRLATHLAEATDVDLADVAYTLAAGRTQHRHRGYVVASGPADAAAALRDRKRLRLGAADGEPRVVLLLSGQGAQYAGMGAELYRTEPEFAAVVDECVAIGKEHLDLDLRDVMFASGTAAEELLGQTRYAQPALFTLEYALARTWQHWGVRPAALVGHSIGEYVAATLSGVFALDDALRLVAARGRLMQELPPGAMLAVQADEADVVPGLPTELAVAAVNGPGTCVVAGPGEDVTRFAERLKADGVGCRPLRTSHAFHSAMMEPMLPRFAALVEAVPRHRPSLPFVSNVTGTWITGEQAVDPDYWTRHVRQPVRFGDGLATVLDGAPPVLLECGPGRQLTGLARLQTGRDGATAVHSLPGIGERTGDLATLCQAVGTLWAAGVPVDGAAPGGPAVRIPLPGYAYQRRRYWVDATAPVIQRPAAPASRTTAPAAATGPLPLDNWFAAPVWRQHATTTTTGPTGPHLVLAAGPRGAALAEALRGADVPVTVVRPGSGPDQLPPADRAAYDRLVAGLAEAPEPTTVVHAWTLDTDTDTDTDTGVDAVWRAQELGYLSAVRLTQAVAAAGASGRVRLVLVTRSTEDVLGGDLTSPLQATLAGVARVAPLELPDLSVRRVDVDESVPATTLVAELTRTDEPEVALRGTRRWLRGYEQLVLPATDDGGPRPEGRYLITGGLGGIGITLAEDLAVRSRARLLLVGRRSLPPRHEWADRAASGPNDTVGRAIGAILRMEAAGARVVTMTADVTDAAALARVRQTAFDEFGGLDGIVHAAGLPGGAMLEVSEPAAARDVLAPKVLGTLALRDTFGDLPLDFVALCSSITSVAGALGQADYCAANAFMDAFARSEHGWPTRVLSLNWGGWSEVGMAVETATPPALAALREPVVEPMSHPMLTQRTAGECTGSLAPETHWVLDEHRINGMPVVPGTGHLEAARAAVTELLPAPAPGHVLELGDVTFLRPFGVPDGASTRYTVTVQVTADTAEFTVRDDGDGPAAVHGSARWTTARPGPFDPAAVTARCRDVTGPRDSHSGLVSFGPRWAALDRHLAGDGEELAVVSAPPAALADLERWVLHPALLDVATSFGKRRGDGSYLPLGYGRVVVHAPLPARFHSHLSYRPGEGTEVVAADLTLADLDGRVLVEIEDFVLRRVDGAAISPVPAAPAPTTPVPTAPAPVASAVVPSGGPGAASIAPVDGAEAFRRALAAEAGAQLVVHPRTVADLLAHRLSVTTVEERVSEPATSGAPVTDLEAAIADVWRQVLGVPDVDTDDDFFELGGNSLVAVQLIAQTRKATGVRVPMRSLFEAPTVAGQAAVARRLRETATTDRTSADRSADGGATRAPTAGRTDPGGPDATGRPANAPTIPRLRR